MLCENASSNVRVLLPKRSFPSINRVKYLASRADIFSRADIYILFLCSTEPFPCDLTNSHRISYTSDNDNPSPSPPTIFSTTNPKSPSFFLCSTTCVPYTIDSEFRRPFSDRLNSEGMNIGAIRPCTMYENICISTASSP